MPRTHIPDTTTTLFGPNGERLDERPTTLLTVEDAALIRNYYYMLLKAGLEFEVFCRTCGHETREDQAQYKIDDEQVIILCGCSALYHKGATPVERLETVELSRDVRVGRDMQIVVANLQMTEAAAKLLRTWKRFLLSHGMLEALRCNACYEANRPDGCRAASRSSSCSIECRCTRYTYTGATT